jgi:hypothetical protein
MARVYVAMSLPKASDRNTVFSAVQVAVNVSAAIGPVIANLLVGRDGGTRLLPAVAAMYGLAAAVVAAALPRGLVSGDGDVRPPLRLGLVRDMVANPEVRRISAVTIAGSFLYAQLFSALALHVADLTDSPLLRAGVFTENAVVVVAAQIPVALLVKRRLDAGAKPVLFLVWGIAGFGASFAVLGAAGALVAGTFAGVAVFSLAETLFTPMVNTAYGEIPGDRPLVELFNMRQVAASIGESLGSFAGGALFLAAERHSAAWGYWTALAVLALAAAVAFRGHISTDVSEVGLP